jgi:FAD:protein FMN transferase
MRILRLIVAVAMLAACSGPASRGAFIETRMFAMGTWVDIVIGARGEPADTAAIAALETMLHSFETDYYAWAENGELAQLNASLRAGTPRRVTPEMAELLDQARTLSIESEGNFDPAVGGLVELWGFHSSLASPARPAAEAIGEWLDTRPSIAELRIEDQVVSADNRRIKLDLGGIAKGKVVDRLIAELTQRGYTDVLVNAGGDVRVRGTRGERAWRIGIQSPRSDGILGTLRLADGEAVFTSGDYERYFDADGQRMHHLLDPRLGLPATHTQAVTVVTREGALADAAATAIFVAGPAHWRDIATRLDVSAVLRVDASGTIEMTDAMAKRIELEPDVAPELVVGQI